MLEIVLITLFGVVVGLGFLEWMNAPGIYEDNKDD
jgi:hypothetical protein